jgi:ABC-2 type transport system permease protein
LKDGTNAATIPSLVEAISYNANVLYNPNMGYGSFVIPSILIVIIQQTIIIGLALMAARRRERGVIITTNPIISALSKILVYTMIYGINLTITLGIIWPIFGFPNMGSTTNVVILLLIYMVSATTLGIATSHLFTRRESPLMLLLWSSIPILLVAGVSYPYEAIP